MQTHDGHDVRLLVEREARLDAEEVLERQGGLLRVLPVTVGRIFVQRDVQAVCGKGKKIVCEHRA